MAKLAGMFYSFSVWVMKLAFLNILWIGFVCFGFVIFGLFPATAATFSICRSWALKDYDISIFNQFYSVYKKEFVKSNKTGLILVIVGLILYFDIRILQETNISFLKPFVLFFYAAGCLFLLSIPYVFPVLIHYETNAFKIIKSSLLLMLVHPLYTITIIASIFCISFILMLFPGVIPFLGVSILSFVIMWISHLVFTKNEAKQLKADT
ncbi:MAG TPA: DUF624 domain-containing protein [Metabacillus sp.]|nr:DUF624 domain-containing protein [Metabacillus sp.]